MKYEEGSFDYVITYLPIFRDDDEAKEFFKELMSQMKYLRKKNICIISREDVKIAKKILKKKIVTLEGIDYQIYIL